MTGLVYDLKGGVLVGLFCLLRIVEGYDIICRAISWSVLLQQSFDDVPGSRCIDVTGAIVCDVIIFYANLRISPLIRNKNVYYSFRLDGHFAISRLFLS